MTPAQTKTIERLRREIERRHCHGQPDKNEFKQFKVSDEGSFVSLVTEYGMKGDEGTMAALVCRDHRHFAIGRNGGVTLLSFYSNLRSSYPKRVRGLFNSVNFYHAPAKADASEATP